MKYRIMQWELKREHNCFENPNMSAAAPVWEPSLPLTLTQFVLNLERTDATYKGLPPFV